MIVKKNKTFNALNGIFLALLVLSILVPFLHMIAVSFSDNASVLTGSVGLIPKGFNIDMYEMVFEDERIITAYGNTILYTIVGTILSLIITGMGAYALSKKSIYGYKTFSMMILITMFFSGGMIPTYLVVNKLGILDTIWGVILPGAVTTWNFIIMRSFFSTFPHEIEEAGAIDGLNDISIFFRLVVPSSKAIFATIGLYYAVTMWNSYFTPFLYLRSEELFPLQMILKELLMVGANDAAGVGDALVVEESLKYATIMVAITPILAVYPFLQKYFAKGALIGSVKG